MADESKARIRSVGAGVRDVAIELRPARAWLLVPLALVGALALAMLARELRLSRFQARYLSGVAARATYGVGPGPSTTITFPSAGPYDERLGYTRIPSFVDVLTARGYRIEAQARFSPLLGSLTRWGLFPSYREKTRAGLSVAGRSGALLFSASYPERAFDDFEAVPPLLVASLLFVENRELLDPRFPRRNPAVEWDRLTRSAIQLGLGSLGRGRDSPGGSTLATQIEKYRHSPGGVTSDPADKLRQIASASVRAYRDGEETYQLRRQIVVDYLNTVPLAAAPGYGEVIGIPSGLEIWYGLDFRDASEALAAEPDASDPGAIREYARTYKQVLSLLLAVQRPSWYLVESPDSLVARTHRYLSLLADAGVISARLRDAAIAERIPLRRDRRSPLLIRDERRKLAGAVRADLLSQLGVSGFYELDRLDLAVETTFEESIQAEIAGALQDLGNPKAPPPAGLVGPRLLETGDPADVVYSFALYERGRSANVLRVQADSLAQPLNVNDGVMLDLGSTAKLRTLATYLGIVASLHRRFGNASREELGRVELHDSDALSRWALARLAAKPGTTAEELVAAAMQRRYSASPTERFFTGGGWHSFRNFDSREDDRTPTVAEAFRESINLVFIRMMRDIARHHMFGPAGSAARILDDPLHPSRELYLRRFAHAEGRTYLEKFYRRYAALGTERATSTLLRSSDPTPKRLAVIVRRVVPQASFADFEEALAKHLPDWELLPKAARSVYDAWDPSRYHLSDQGYLAGLHPLELWLVAYLAAEPGASLEQVVDASSQARLDAYRWLFRTRRKSAQDSRIRSMLEQEAFASIHAEWKRQGYPFDSLVPSYSTAIGSSADRPSALAELVGIVLNDGVRLPTTSVERWRFAAETPYETVLVAAPGEARRAMPREVAATLRAALVDTVEHGTGRRARGALAGGRDAAPVVGGKTGTGDNVYKVVGSDGEVIESRVVSRAATFVFFIGERFYGVVTAYVTGPTAARYRFTSSLATQLFRNLAPRLEPLLATEPPPGYELRS